MYFCLRHYTLTHTTLHYTTTQVFSEISLDIPNVHLLTSAGANAKSFFLYLKTKGEAEENYKNLNFQNLTIWRPGMLDRGSATRTTEKIS